MKTVLADGMLAGTADAVFNATAPLPSLDAWMGSLAFAGQIFFDFAGYSTCAIGVALCLGFILPQNFRFPYAATSFSDFWRRWHITLSAWLRDYLYIPLGGNRKGTARTYVNLMITMLIGGLWHGANWTFVAWGGLHGLYLCVERFFRERRGGPATQHGGLVIMPLFIFFFVNITWVFFRAGTFAQAGGLLASMFGFVHGATPILTTLAMVKVGVVVAGLLVTQWLLRNTSLTTVAYRMPWWLTGLAWSSMLLLIILGQESSGSFIYFQF
jgi:D-alanyl-lipoteichoic acid acyltransferase DltB (MBOAT superfamily)